MRRHAVLITLLVSQLIVTALALVFHFQVRASVLTAFQEYGTPIPPLTRLALSSWLLPGAVGVAGLLAALAFAAPRFKRSQRMGVFSAGIVISSVALVFAVWAAFAPLFRPE